MPQRQITINAYPLIDSGPNSYTVSLDLSGKSPSKRFDIETVADCKAALAAFAAELDPLRQTLAPERLLRQTIGPQARWLRQGPRRPRARMPRQRASRRATRRLTASAKTQPHPKKPALTTRAFSHLETDHEDNRLVPVMRLQRTAKASLSSRSPQPPESARRGAEASAGGLRYPVQ